MAVPWCTGQGQLKLFGELSCDQPSLVTQRGEGASGAAELKRDRFALEPQQAQPRPVECCGIFGKLQPKRHGQRMLKPGAGHDRRMAMLSRKPREAFDCTAEIDKQRVDARAQGGEGGGIDSAL